MTYPNDITSPGIAGAYWELRPLFDRRDTRKIQNNTWATIDRDTGAITIRYHATDILIYHGDDTMTINTAGYHTTTTAARFRNWLPRNWSVANDRGVWNVWAPTGEFWTGIKSTYRDPFIYPVIAPAFRVWDGMTITDTPRQRVVNYRGAPDFTSDDRLRDTIAGMIAEYVALYTSDRIAKLFGNGHDPAAGAIPGAYSTAGDCLFCSMGSPIDRGTDHIVSHLIERYTMASVIRNAYASRGYGDPDLIVWMNVRDPHGSIAIRREVSRYIAAILIPKNIPAITLGELEFARAEYGLPDDPVSSDDDPGVRDPSNGGQIWDGVAV